MDPTPEQLSMDVGMRAVRQNNCLSCHMVEPPTVTFRNEMDRLVTIPAEVHRLPRPQLARFLSRLMAVDGGVRVASIGHACVGYTSVSEAFAGQLEQVRLLGLQGEADTDRDGHVEVGELFRYIKPNVSKLARRINREQTPTLFPPEGTAGGLMDLRITR